MKNLTMFFATIVRDDYIAYIWETELNGKFKIELGLLPFQTTCISQILCS